MLPTSRLSPSTSRRLPSARTSTRCATSLSLPRLRRSLPSSPSSPSSSTPFPDVSTARSKRSRALRPPSLLTTPVLVLGPAPSSPPPPTWTSLSLSKVHPRTRLPFLETGSGMARFHCIFALKASSSRRIFQTSLRAGEVRLVQLVNCEVVAHRLFLTLTTRDLDISPNPLSSWRVSERLGRLEVSLKARTMVPRSTGWSLLRR